MKEIEAMGFRTESALQMTREIQTTIQNLLIILGAVSVVILLVAAFSIANTISMSVMTRVKEIGIMRSYGATKGQISKLFLMESLIIGVGGGVWGVISGLVVSKLADLYLLKLVPDVTFKPANFFLFPWWLIGGAIVMAVCLSLLAGFIPSRQAANLTPIEALGR
jgi:putative ABC transport system permease protein